jgi:hypothetical protein
MVFFTLPVRSNGLVKRNRSLIFASLHSIPWIVAEQCHSPEHLAESLSEGGGLETI